MTIGIESSIHKIGLHYDIHSKSDQENMAPLWHSFEGQSVDLTFWYWNSAWSRKFDSQNMASLWHSFEGLSTNPRNLLWNWSCGRKFNSKNEVSLWHSFEGQSAYLRIWHWNYACSRKFDSQNKASMTSISRSTGWRYDFTFKLSSGLKVWSRKYKGVTLASIWRLVGWPYVLVLTFCPIESSIQKIWLHYDIHLKAIGRL